jgi:hypothetical protein
MALVALLIINRRFQLTIESNIIYFDMNPCQEYLQVLTILVTNHLFIYLFIYLFNFAN